MNSHLPDALRDALNGSFRRPVRTSLVQVISDDATANEPCHLTRKSSGSGLSDYTQVVCSCGFVGPERYESDDFKSTQLAADEREHVHRVKEAQR